MSVTNAISSVIVVGALIAAGVDVETGSNATRVFGFLAVIMVAVNIFGGFLVTERMLAMYKPKQQ
jgi:NAD(P) transhydrogenase subunit alpha